MEKKLGAGRAPEYCLLKNYSQGDLSFPVGTCVQPVWNAGYLTRERRDEIEKDIEWFSKFGNDNPKLRVWCMIGPHWLLVPVELVGTK